MEALSLRPKFLDCISSEVYQEKDKWKIDDIALGPANELLISGHNPVIHKIFISMYKEDSGKYGNRPELNKNFDQTQPGEQLALFLGGSPMIGLKVENALQILSIKDMCVYKTIKLRRLPTSVCFYKGTLYAASSSSNIVSACSLDSEDETNITLSNMENDCALKIVVLMEKIYVCTKYDGRALVFSMTGSKKMEFANAIQTDAMATSICIQERTEFVFVLWNNIQIQIYSQKTSRFLFALNMSEQLHKLCVTPENILVTSSGSKCKVTFYDVDEAIKFGEFENTLLSSVKKKHRKKLMSNDGEMQSKVENLRDMTELYIQLLKENDNLRIKYERDIQKLNLDIERSNKEKDDVTEKLKKTKSNLSSKEADLSDVQAKLDASINESDDLRRMITEKEEKCCSLTKKLEAEKKTTEEGEAIKYGEFQNTILSSVKKKHRKTLISNDEANLEVDTADFELRPKNWKSAPKQSKVENLRDTKELYMKQLEENKSLRRKYDINVQQLNLDIERSNKEKDDVTEKLENTRSNLSSKEAELSDVQAKLDASLTESDDLRRMNIEKEKKCCRLTKQLEAERKTTEQGGITKDVLADSIEYMKTGLKGLIDEINDDTEELMKKKKNVMKELESTNSTLEKKEVDLSKIQDELDAAISKKKELEKTAMETDTLKQIIEAKENEIQRLQRRLKIAEAEVKNAKTQVTILQDRNNELVESVSREQKRSEELEGLLSNFAFLIQNIAQLEDANNRLKIEHDKADKTQTLLSKILENLDRDALVLKTESEIVKEILKTKGKQKDMLVCLQSDINSRIEKLKREAELLEYKMGQENKIIDFEKKNRSALPDMVEQSSTNNDKQEVTAMGLEHKALPDNANTLDKETMLQTLSLTKEEQINMIHNQTPSVTVNRAEILGPGQMLRGPMTRTPKENKKELVEKASTEENVSTPHHDSNLLPLTPKRLPEDEQMLGTRKEGVTEMTSFQAGTYSRLEQIQNFRVTKENRQLSFIENKLQSVQDKLQYETFQFEYLKDLFKSSDNLLGVLQQSTFLKTVDALVKEISNGKDKLGKLKDNRDNTVKEYEVQRDWFELHELQVSLVVSQDGGKLKIPGSDVSLDIPPGALQEQHEIQMKIIPHCLDPGGDSLSFSSNSSVVVELLPNKLQFQKTVHLRLPHCLHLNENYDYLKDVKVLISHHDKDDAPNWGVSTDTECKLEKDHCVIPLKKFCWITYRVDDKVVIAKRLKIFTAGRDLELSDRVSEVEVGYFPDLPGSGEILRKNPKLSRGQIKPFLFLKNEEGLTLQISLQQVIPNEWQNESSLGNKQIISYQSICTGTEMSCPFHLQYTPEGSPRGKVPLCLFHASQENAEQIHITFRPEVKCDED